jgi:hypothetical protein
MGMPLSLTHLAGFEQTKPVRFTTPWHVAVMMTFKTVTPQVVVVFYPTRPMLYK